MDFPAKMRSRSKEGLPRNDEELPETLTFDFLGKKLFCPKPFMSKSLAPLLMLFLFTSMLMLLLNSSKELKLGAIAASKRARV